MQAVVEGGDHLVLTLDAGVDAGQRAEPVEPQHGQPLLGERAQVTAGPLDPQHARGPAGHRVSDLPLRGGVAACVVGVARIRPEPVAAGQQRGHLVGCL